MDNKQAILLLAHKGLDYIDKFCEQFNNDERFDIFIHYDKKLNLSSDNINSIKNKYKNIKKIYSEVNGNYFGMSLIDAELSLIEQSYNTDNYKYYHLMSEQCFITVSLDIFYDYFNMFFNTVFMDFTYNKEGWQIIDKESGLCWAGSQWWSIPNIAIEWILNKLETTNYYLLFREKIYLYNKDRKIRIIAADETFFTNIFKIYENDFKYLSNKRYIDFTFPLIDWSHPHDLVIYKLDKYLKEGILYNLIVRKIDYKKIDSWNLLKQIKYINRYASNIIIST